LLESVRARLALSGPHRGWVLERAATMPCDTPTRRHRWSRRAVSSHPGTPHARSATRHKDTAQTPLLQSSASRPKALQRRFARRRPARTACGRLGLSTRGRRDFRACQVDNGRCPAWCDPHGRGKAGGSRSTPSLVRRPPPPGSAGSLDPGQVKPRHLPPRERGFIANSAIGPARATSSWICEYTNRSRRCTSPPAPSPRVFEGRGRQWSRLGRRGRRKHTP